MNVLEIARKAADDLSLDHVDTLYGAVEPGDTTARRLRRAIERTCDYLRTTQSWDVSEVEHEFLTVAGELQSGAIPDDFSAFVGNTIFDHARRLPLAMAETAEMFAAIKGMPIATYQSRWIKRGGDILIAPPVGAGCRITYQYTSTAVCIEPPVAHDVVVSTETPLQLRAGQRCVVRHAHTVLLPLLADDETVELVPESGTWETLGATIETPGSIQLSIIDIDPKSQDIVSIGRAGAGYDMVAAVGAWRAGSVATTNGMTLEAGRRYIVQQGHMLHLPILAPGQRIEVYPAGGSWRSMSSRFITRDGLVISPQLPGYTAAAEIVADMAATPPYLLQPITTASGEVWSVNGTAQRGRGRRKSQITTDRDVPLWDADLVILGAVWLFNWRDGQPFGEDFRAFERRIYAAFSGQGVGMVDMGAHEHTRRPRRHFTAVIDNSTPGQGT